MILPIYPFNLLDYTLSSLSGTFQTSIEFNKSKGKNGSVRFTADAIASYIESQSIKSYGDIL